MFDDDMTMGRAAWGDLDGIALRPARGRREPAAWIVRPAAPRPGAAPLVVVHGITRNAEDIARLLAPLASEQGRVLIAPLFAEPDFPGYQRAFGRNRPDRALLALLASLADEGVLARMPVDLAGFSGGAQFAHRFAWAYPHRVGRLAVAAAGWWTFPDAAPFPYGLGASARRPEGPSRWLRANAPDFLDREIAVAVGALDCAPDANTRSGPAIDAQQGRDRLTRARRWADALRAAAERLGLEPRVSLTVLPGAGHDFLACADAGLDRLFLPSTN